MYVIVLFDNAGVCPKDCSDHGTCVTISEMSLLRGPDYNTAVEYSGDGIGVNYSNWDKDSVTLCNCDTGRFGPDCSLGKHSFTFCINYLKVVVYQILPYICFSCFSDVPKGR
jgi:hypothetical protein